MIKIKRILIAALGILLLMLLAPPFSVKGASTAAVSIPATAFPGGQITISGSGYQTTSANAIAINIVDVNTYSTIVGANGVFSVNITIPYGSGGIHKVQITSTLDIAMTGSISISPLVSVNVTSGKMGDSIAATGVGFQPSTQVRLFLYSKTYGSAPTSTNPIPVASTTSTALGNINCVITVPQYPLGIYSIVGADAQAASVAATFNVTPNITVPQNAAKPFIEGGQLLINGFGFSTSSNVTFQIDGTAIAGYTAATLADGSFTTNITLPALAKGFHNVTATDTPLNISPPASFVFGTSINLTPMSGIAGVVVTVKGSGFNGGVPISITYDGAVAVSTPARITSSPLGLAAPAGTFSATFIVPLTPAGIHNVSASDGTTAVSASFTSTGSPLIYTNVSSGKMGDSITVTGAGFQPNTMVQLYLYNKTYGSTPTSTNPAPVASTTSDHSGSINCVMAVPRNPIGSYSLVGADTQNISTAATFSVTPSITVPQDPAKPFIEGAQLLINGFGFSASSNATFQINGTALAGYTTATLADGSFTTNITLPALAKGSHNVTATDTAKNVSPAASFVFGTSINLTPMSGTAGIVVTVKGSGFNGGVPISITYDESATVTTPAVVTSSPLGTAAVAGIFSATFMVPGGLAGVHTIAASDGTNAVSATYTSSLSAVINPVTSAAMPGYVGQAISVNGLGFNPTSTISVRYDTTQIASATASATGVFTAAFKSPASKGGSHTITVSDGTNSRTFGYFMESTPPAAPVLSSPLNMAEAVQPLIFAWGAVSDTSGVTYNLQISREPTFTSLILNQTGLQTPTYTMGPAEKLPSADSGNPYLWRVIAVDGTGNAGPASAINTFTIGFSMDSMPKGALFAVGLAGPLLMGGVAYLIMKLLRG